MRDRSEARQDSVEIQPNQIDILNNEMLDGS